MTFTLSVNSNSELSEEALECGSASNCKIEYKRSYSPVLYYLSPPIVYYESFTDFWFDPRDATNLI
jgi:hypothetical protein